jgi:hypothetical protein
MVSISKTTPSKQKKITASDRLSMKLAKIKDVPQKRVYCLKMLD